MTYDAYVMGKNGTQVCAVNGCDCEESAEVELWKYVREMYTNRVVDDYGGIDYCVILESHEVKRISGTKFMTHRACGGKVVAVGKFHYCLVCDDQVSDGEVEKLWLKPPL